MKQIGRPRAEVPSRYAGSLPAAAEWLGVSLHSLREASREPSFPRRSEHGHDLLELVRWQITGRSGTSEGESTEEAERRKKVADADKAEMDRDERRGRLMSRLDHDRDQIELVTSFVSALDALPSKLTPLLVAARGFEEIDATLRAHIRAMRVQLAAKHAPPSQDEAGAAAPT